MIFYVFVYYLVLHLVERFLSGLEKIEEFQVKYQAFIIIGE